ncbi:hypothetical protein [Methanobrevibacter sp. DSM 116169]|uniref:hypothetical protein n=1 Tax=Methanobrevibacter sp. DSM 116169 TaxID=3242727 RepID=UPI0038FC862C
MTCTTKISKYNKTTIPPKIVKKYNLQAGDTIIWNRIDNYKIELEFIKKSEFEEFSNKINDGV